MQLPQPAILFYFGGGGVIIGSQNKKLYSGNEITRTTTRITFSLSKKNLPGGDIKLYSLTEITLWRKYACTICTTYMTD